MIAAIVLHIVIVHGQMTVPWIGGAKAATAPVAQSIPVLVLTDGVIVLAPDQLIVLE